MVHLEKRSWHRRVTFEHPWSPGTTVCADGEWEKRGKKKSQIRIQKPKTNMKKCLKDKQLQDIGLKSAAHMVVGPTHTITVAAPRTVTVVPAPPVVVTTITLLPPPEPSIVTILPVPLPPVVFTTVTTLPTVAGPPISFSTVTAASPSVTTILSVGFSTLQHRDL
jgi:hypothetical protein